MTVWGENVKPHKVFSDKEGLLKIIKGWGSSSILGCKYHLLGKSHEIQYSCDSVDLI